MSKFEYFKQFKGKSERTEITYDQALDVVLGSWNDTDLVRDMLLTPNRIDCRFSVITVEEVSDDGNRRVLMAGCSNMINPDYEYNEEDFSRVKC